ncbi:MAG: sodium:solute symporter [Cyclobacteriaceae bacterium]|nr:sodium:solute symporter [Cyclobacteriaceae bacterium]
MIATLSLIDLIIVFAYFAVVFYIARWATLRRTHSHSDAATADYFLSGKSEGWFVIGAALFASNIGSEIILGLAGSGARADMPNAQFEILASLVLIILGWVFVPFYLKTGVYTMPQFLEMRYSSAARNYLSVVSILAYVLTKISLIIFSGALIFDMFGIPFWTGAIIIVLSTGFYTVLGGLTAVIYTDMVQTFILLAGTIAVTYIGLDQLGGWNEMTNTIAAASTEPGNPSVQQFFNMWRPMSDTNYPWTGMLFGAPILGVWYWCTDQFIVQKVLSAKNVSEARKGSLFAGFLKLLPVFIFLVPGIIAYALMKKGLLVYSLDNPDQAMPAMITTLLPVGLKGLAIAALLAALMSSLSSAFNSSSTLFTIDFYKRWKPEASEKKLVRVGQLATVVLVLVSLAWIPFMKTLMGGGMFHYLQSIQAYISPPIAAVFLLGLFIKRINARGAIVALWSGFVLGVTRLVTEFMAKEGMIRAEEGSLLHTLLGINFLHYALFLFLFCAVILILVSLTAPQQSDEQLKLVTYQKQRGEKSTGFKTDLWLTLLLIAAVLVLWILFSPWGLAG